MTMGLRPNLPELLLALTVVIGLAQFTTLTASAAEELWASKKKCQDISTAHHKRAISLSLQARSLNKKIWDEHGAKTKRLAKKELEQVTDLYDQANEQRQLGSKKANECLRERQARKKEAATDLRKKFGLSHSDTRTIIDWIETDVSEKGKIGSLFMEQLTEAEHAFLMDFRNTDPHSLPGRIAIILAVVKWSMERYIEYNENKRLMAHCKARIARYLQSGGGISVPKECK